MKKLNPKSVWMFFLQYSFGFIFFVAVMVLCFGLPVVLSILEDSDNFGAFGSIMAIFILGLVIFSVLVFGLSFVFAKLAYNNYLYELKPEGFYKESGVITKKYVTIPYERIQNVDINRGILARVLGLSDLQIQTAGMSASFGRYGAYGVGAEGRLPGVSEAEAREIRDELIKRAKGAQQGL